MNRIELKPDVQKCVLRIEHAVETLIFDYQLAKVPTKKDYSKDYRLELDFKGNDEIPRIRIRAGSKDERKIFYIGRVEPAVNALIFLREYLCEKAFNDLQQILNSNRWINFESETEIFPYTPEEIMNTMIEVCNQTNSLIRPRFTRVHTIDGLFFDNEFHPRISYVKLECIIDLLDDEKSLDERIRKAIQEVTPEMAKYSFSKTKTVGKHWFGDFSERYKYLYFDIGWFDNKYVLHIVNLAGFPRKCRRP